ncbi:hypothetical protein GCM10025867_47600 (plasmid) [Frondihabitans sucicola]|uniref:GmrSD restriction endonucleases C-terminal domain-containing protein n=1 Tax=Frondihabitans sucicola TaxID=1268041 RepID=A0ABM8GVM4_9MICO|nr:HNH endonuclease family protein [Frondihabitans sucicola]BDZ52519.1 hypothetical protein GCM10025867_47600 [Frondihabitans sucicola]
MAKSNNSEELTVFIVIALIVVVGLSGGKLNFGLGGNSADAATGTAASLANGSSMSISTATNTLATIPEVPDGSMAGYSRELFPHWEKATANGWSGVPAACDSREAALIRDGKDVKYSKTCSITSGSWVDPYTGTKATKSGDMDIDHLVPLAAAWRSGASKWTTAQRQKFANDPLVLVTAGASANRSKGDRGPDQWVPPAANAQCEYAVRWVEIKGAYQLTATASEKLKLGALLKACPTATPSPSPTPSKKS